MDQDNRVLTRRGARELSEQEVETRHRRLQNPPHAYTLLCGQQTTIPQWRSGHWRMWSLIDPRRRLWWRRLFTARKLLKRR